MSITETPSPRVAPRVKRGDWEEVLGWSREWPLHELCACADAVCRQHHGDGVWLRGLIEVSNHCARRCWYCGIRAPNRTVPRYRMDRATLLETVRAGFEAGLRTFVIQGGEDPGLAAAEVAEWVAAIRELTRGQAAITLSLGLRDRATYALWRQAGAQRYLMRFETANPVLFERYRPGTSLAQRLRALEWLRELDYEVGSGFLVGLPGETPADREAAWRLCWEWGFDMVGIGPFLPHPNTPLGDSPQQPLWLCQQSVAVVRMLLPQAHLPATTAAGTLHPRGREIMLASGANVLMPNLTPVPLKRAYELYPGKVCVDESGLACLTCLDLRVRTVGKVCQNGVGSAPWRRVDDND